MFNEQAMEKFYNDYTWHFELKYSERPGFKRMMKDIKAKKVNCVVMSKGKELSLNPGDVREACQKFKDMDVKVIFEEDKLTGEEVLRLSKFELDNLTVNTMKEDFLAIINSEKSYNELMKG